MWRRRRLAEAIMRRARHRNAMLIYGTKCTVNAQKFLRQRSRLGRRLLDYQAIALAFLGYELAVGLKRQEFVAKPRHIAPELFH
jgi:hypothetical protein